MVKDVVFVSMEGKKDFLINDFPVREDVALPVLLEEGKSFSIDDLTPENIISGMLKVITEDSENEHIDYYKDFIFSIEPGIEARLVNIAYEAEYALHFDDALEIYKVLYALKPDSLDHTLNIAICYDDYSNYLFSQGINSEAEKLENYSFQFFQKVEEFEDKDDRAYYYLGRFYLSRENIVRAGDYFGEFLKLTDDQDKKKEVMELLRDLKTEGINDEIYQNAVWLVQSDKEEEALKVIDEFIKKYRSSWHGFFIKGLALRKLGNFLPAIDNFKKALELNPSSSDIFNELGVCYMNMGDFTKCRLNFVNALRINPDDLAVMYNLALASYKQGDKNEAVKYCNVIMELNPKDLEAKKLKSIIEDVEE